MFAKLPRITMSSESAQSPSSPPFMDLDSILKNPANKFTLPELTALLAKFITIANYSLKCITNEPLETYNLSEEDKEQLSKDIGVTDLSLSTFGILFTDFGKYPEVAQALYNAMISDSTATGISFLDYIIFMSIVARDTPKRRQDLALKVLSSCATNGEVQKDTFLRIVQSIHAYRVACGDDVQFEPQVLADMVFVTEYGHDHEQKPVATTAVSEEVDIFSMMDAPTWSTSTQEQFNPLDELMSHLRNHAEDGHFDMKQIEALSEQIGGECVVDVLSVEEFTQRVLKVSQIHNCFGLYARLDQQHLTPIIAMFSPPKRTKRPIMLRSTRHGVTQTQAGISLGTTTEQTLRNIHTPSFDVMELLKSKMGEKDESADVSLPSLEGILLVKKGPTNMTNVQAKVSNGFLLLARDQQPTRPFKVMRLNEAFAEPHPDAPYTETAFLLHATSSSTFAFYTKATTSEDRDEWIKAINDSSSLNRLEPNPYDSFAAEHQNVGTHFYTCGRDYFADLAKNLHAATRHVFISGWHVTPELYLVRNGNRDEMTQNQLHNILLARAEAGVKIYILVWRDKFMNLSSGKVEEILKHKNIFVIRDPSLLTSHFWTHHQKMVTIDGAIGYVGGIDVAIGRFDTHEFPILDEDEELFPGIDYANSMAKYDRYGDPIDNTDFQKRGEVPRMPWHDVQCKLLGAPVLDLERNFIERWEVSRSDEEAIIEPVAAPQTPAIPQDDIAKDHSCTVQVLRSVSSWSFDFTQTENSMLTAQLKAIREAKRFIFLDNQFFISSSGDPAANPKNLILNALVERIEQAHNSTEEEQKQFRVIMLFPHQPSSSLRGAFSKQVLFWIYATLYRKSWSFAEKLKSLIGEEKYKEYVHVSSLRNHGTTKAGVVLTEMVYPHTKLMIVDDEVGFVSSHNVNDRSMLGSGDSEIGVVVSGGESVEVTYASQKCTASKVVHELRKELYRVLLGLALDRSEDNQIENAFDAFEMWAERSSKNKDLYLKVFTYTHHNVEHDSQLDRIDNYHEPLEERKNVLLPSAEDYNERVEKLKEIKGYVEDFPQDFFKKVGEGVWALLPAAIKKYFL